MILDYIDILNKSLGELGIKNAVLVLQPTTVHSHSEPDSQKRFSILDKLLAAIFITYIIYQRNFQRIYIGSIVTGYQHFNVTTMIVILFTQNVCQIIMIQFKVTICKSMTIRRQLLGQLIKWWCILSTFHSKKIVYISQ